ncbi:hypothetical protein Taro_015213 [Colocasia esculenta]|uniref:Uncharacterized protein n=1 Tax=Colocasia esculenta TaxID=4460 RepID=A0A843ULJ4_COLES|nr:hypothetical protein [Colocasia esculenta]
MPISKLSTTHMADQIKLIISNEGTIFTTLAHLFVLCQAPEVHTLAVNKYVGALLPRTGPGPYCTDIGSNLDRSPTLCRTNRFILWPQSFNNKLVCRHNVSNTRQNDQVVSTQDPVVSTQCFNFKAKWSSSVDTRSGSVDTRDPSQNTLWANLRQCVDTRSGSVDTRDLPRTPSGLFWDSVSTLDQVVSTLVALPEKTYKSCVTRKHVSCSDSFSPLITL